MRLWICVVMFISAVTSASCDLPEKNKYGLRLYGVYEVGDSAFIPSGTVLRVAQLSTSARDSLSGDEVQKLGVGDNCAAGTGVIVLRNVKDTEYYIAELRAVNRNGQQRNNVAPCVDVTMITLSSIEFHKVYGSYHNVEMYKRSYISMLASKPLPEATSQ